MTELTSSRRNGRPRGYVDDWRPQAKTCTLLEDVRRVLDRYAEHLPLTVRQIFYALVGAEQLEKTEAQYARLCYALNMARRARRIEFGDIRDDGVSLHGGDGLRRHRVLSRRDRPAGERTTAATGRKGSRPHVELWCEAAGMVPQLAASRRTIRSRSTPLAASRRSPPSDRSSTGPWVVMYRTVLLHVGDLDPSGESIFTAMSEDAAAFVEADRTLATSSDRRGARGADARAGSEFHLPTAPAKATDSRSNGWHGGTCQLEALPPDVLAALVRECDPRSPGRGRPRGRRPGREGRAGGAARPARRSARPGGAPMSETFDQFRHRKYADQERSHMNDEIPPRQLGRRSAPAWPGS